jgi:phage tail-like protein
MTITSFAAQADIVGRRIRIAWDFVPAAGEALADSPVVVLRRKQRDYAFPVPGGTDPYLVYDAANFPPAPVAGSLIVTDLDDWETIQDGERHVYQPISVAVSANGRFVEVLRRTTVTVFDSSGVALRQRVEIVDVGARPGALRANEVYYYQLFGPGLPASGQAAEPYRSSAMVTDCYGQNRAMYQALPEVYRRHDVVTRPAAPGTDSVPELAPNFGQLRRFLDPFGIALDSLRGTAEGLPTLHDVDNVDAKYLSMLAQWVGWDLNIAEEAPLRRNEIKAASRLYRLVGTLPGLRALVSQYTGWFTQIAEFAQNIALSNQPPKRNLFGITLGADNVSWVGVDDAAELLGFAAANQEAGGSASTAATLTGTVAEPFALRPGMSLTLAIDGDTPSSVRFGPADFVDISKALATEVAAAINRALVDVNAQAASGKLVLASDSVGAQSLLEVVPAATSLISLECAPSGRLSPCTDSAGRLRLFYEAWETPTQPAPGIVGTSGPAAAQTGNYVLRRARYKTFLDGAWRDSQPMFPERVVPQGGPAALVLPDDRIWVAWLDDPLTVKTRLRWALGRSRAPQPARLLGQKSEPFALTDGAVLTLVGNWAGADTYTVHVADFADLTRASAAEVVAAMNGQLTRTTATREPNGSIRLATLAGGARARVAIDLRQSTTARALGFDARNATGAPGSWSEVIDWSVPLDVPSIGPGHLAEPAALNDPAGGARIAWATHRGGLWRIVTAHWSDQAFVGTANGLFLRSGAGAWGPVAGLPSTDIRAVVVDANGTAWIATAAGVALRRPDGTIALLTPALPSTDVRDIALGPDSSAYFATAAGIAIRAPGGVVSTVSGLPSNDVRALALCADGTLWAATAAGAVRRSRGGALATFNTTTGLPANSVQGVACAGDTIYLATTAGLAISVAGGGFLVVNAQNGLGSSNARAVAVAADDTVWVATAGGVSRRSPEGNWTVIDSARGLNSVDARSVALGPDGTAWAGTAAGTSIIAADGTVSALDLVGGAADPAGRCAHTGWSAILELGNGGTANREPGLALDANNRTWLVWAQCMDADQDIWCLHYRVYDPPTRSWGADTALTAPPVGGRSADRTPSAQPLPAGMRVFFASDRHGGLGLWSVDVSLAGIVSPLVALPDQAPSDLAPTPVTVGGAVWLLYRSDENVSLAQVRPPTPETLGSVRVHDNGALRRYAGTISADLADLNRLRTRRTFGDMLSYTPNRPDGAGALADSELYTRGTVGLYVSRASRGAELNQQQAERLRQLLQRFIPINLRALVILVESPELELVYGAGTDLVDSFRDDYPFVSALGPISDSTAAAMTGLFVLQSNKSGNVSANPANLTTLRGRTFFPPLQ